MQWDDVSRQPDSHIEFAVTNRRVGGLAVAEHEQVAEQHRGEDRNRANVVTELS